MLLHINLWYLNNAYKKVILFKNIIKKIEGTSLEISMLKKMKKLPGNENFRRMTLLDVSSKFSQNYLELFFIVSTNRTNKSFRIDFLENIAWKLQFFRK